MPVLDAYAPPTEVSQPALRRVWPHPELQSHSLLVLTLDQIYLSPLTGPPRPEVVAAADFGDDLNELLGSVVTIIELASIRRLKLDLLLNSITIEYIKSGSAQRVSLAFSNTESADMCFSRIWRRLGDSSRLENVRSWRKLARAPFFLMTVVLLFTALLSLAIHVMEDLAAGHSAASVNMPGDTVIVPRSPLHNWIGAMDWRVVCVLGGAAAAATQVWFYRRITQPPLALEVVRD